MDVENNIATKPALPPGVLYRHHLYSMIWLLIVAEMAAFLFTSPLWDFGIIGKAIVCALCLGVLLFWLGQTFWLEKHGWWAYRPVVAPELPVQLSGLGWKATFDFQGISAQSSLWRGDRFLDYSRIKLVDAAAKGRGAREIFIVEHGKTPLTLLLNDDELMIILALLTHYAPHAQFRGSLAPMSQGWRPRFWAEWI